MNDEALTDAKDALAQLSADNRKQVIKGVGVLFLFLVMWSGFIGGALWAASRIDTQVKAAVGNE